MEKITRPSRMTTSRLQCHWEVRYDILRQNFTGGTAKVVTGPDGAGGEYTDFEDIRRIIAIKRGVAEEDILVLSITNDLEI